MTTKEQNKLNCEIVMTALEHVGCVGIVIEAIPVRMSVDVEGKAVTYWHCKEGSHSDIVHFSCRTWLEHHNTPSDYTHRIAVMGELQ